MTSTSVGISPRDWAWASSSITVTMTGCVVMFFVLRNTLRRQAVAEGLVAA